MRKFLTSILFLSLVMPVLTSSPAQATSLATWSSATLPGSSSSNYWNSALSNDGHYMAVTDAGGGCVYYSHDYGSTWSQAASSCSAAARAITMSSSGQFEYILDSSNYLWSSVDYGATWVKTSTRFASSCLLSTNPAGTILIGGCDSTSFAYNLTPASSTTWTISSVPGCGYLAGSAISSDSTLAIVACMNEIEKGTITTAGSTVSVSWASMNTTTIPDFNSADLNGFAASSDLSILYLGDNNNNNGRIYKSTDYGVTWSLDSPTTASGATSFGHTQIGNAYGSINVSTSGSGSLIAVGTESGYGVYVSANGGTTWNQENSCQSGGGAHSVRFSQDGSHVLCTTFGTGSSTLIYLGVFPTSTTSALTLSSPTVIYGQSVTESATVSSGGSVATSAGGTFKFQNNGTAISGCTTSPIVAGVAACSFTPASSGTLSALTAVYSGSGNLATSTSPSVSLSVAKATLTVQPSATSVVYSGTPTYLYSISGYVNSDGSSVVSGSASCTSSYTTSTMVGTTIAFSCTAGTLSATNYVFNSSGTAALTITQATPTISASLNSASPVYGSVDTITATSGVAGATTFFAGGVAIAGCSAVATTLVSPFTATCGWVPAGVTSYSLTATITPTDTVDYSTATSSALTPTSSRAAITITPTSNQSKLYGSADPALTYTITTGALVGSDHLSGSLSYTSAGQNTAVGSYAIILGTLTSSNNPNYTITLNSSPVNFTINQASQSAVSLSALSATFNASNKSVTLTGSGGSGSGAYSYALDAGNITPGCSVSGSTLTYTTAGTCIIDVTKAASTNYTAQTNAVSFSIGLAPQTITFGSIATQTYSSTPFVVRATATSGLSVVFSTGSPSVCTSSGTNGASITFLNVGTCVIDANQSGDSSNAQAAQVVQSFTVQAAPITVTADAKTKAYGAADPLYTYSITTGSLVTGDSLTGILSRVSGSDAGTYAITAGTLTSANNPKYAITFVSANLTITQIAPTLSIAYPNNNIAILTPGATDTATVTTASSNGTLSFATNSSPSICSVDSNSGIISEFGAGTCVVAMTAASTTNYLEGTDTVTVTVVLLSSSLSGINPSNLISMGGTFYASPVLTQTITASAGSNGASVSIPANALPSTTAISINLLTDPSAQLALISGASSSVLSVVVSWVSPDGSVPQTSAGNPISVTLTNPSIKSGAKVYSVVGNASNLIGTATQDGSITTTITSDPVLVVVNPVVVPVATPAPSGGSVSYQPAQIDRITGNSPETGPTAGGNTETISGNFAQSGSCRVSNIQVAGNNLSPSQWNVTENSILITMPAHANGSVVIQIYDGCVPFIAPISYLYADAAPAMPENSGSTVVPVVPSGPANPAPSMTPVTPVTPVTNVQPSPSMKKLATFYFGSGLAQLTQVQINAIQAIAKSINSSGYRTVLVYGFTDATPGTNNTLLSRVRAASVKAALGKLLKHKSILTGWYGSSRPLAAGSSPAANAKNRRVEIWVK